MKHECPATCPQRSSNCPTDRARKSAADSRFSFMTHDSPANLADSLIQRARSSRFGSTWLFQRRDPPQQRDVVSLRRLLLSTFFSLNRETRLSRRDFHRRTEIVVAFCNRQETLELRAERKELARRDETPRAELITRQSESSKAPGLSVPIQSPGITLSSSRLPPRLPLKSLNPPRNGIAALRAACD